MVEKEVKRQYRHWDKMRQVKNGVLRECCEKVPNPVLKVEKESWGHFVSIDLKDIGEGWGGWKEFTSLLIFCDFLWDGKWDCLGFTLPAYQLCGPDQFTQPFHVQFSFSELEIIAPTWDNYNSRKLLWALNEMAHRKHLAEYQASSESQTYARYHSNSCYLG